MTATPRDTHDILKAPSGALFGLFVRDDGSLYTVPAVPNEAGTHLSFPREPEFRGVKQPGAYQ